MPCAAPVAHGFLDFTPESSELPCPILGSTDTQRPPPGRARPWELPQHREQARCPFLGGGGQRQRRPERAAAENIQCLPSDSLRQVVAPGKARREAGRKPRLTADHRLSKPRARSPNFCSVSSGSPASPSGSPDLFSGKKGWALSTEKQEAGAYGRG